MHIYVKLDKEDITTRPFGGNIAITPEDGPIEAIILSPEAARELVTDLWELLNMSVEVIPEEP